MTNKVVLPNNKTSYAEYKEIEQFPSRCIELLMNESEEVWKLLKYNTPDALSKSNLTRVEKAALIYSGQENLTDFRVFMDVGQPDVWVDEVTIIRLSLYSITPNDRSRGTFSMMFECMSHYKTNHLNNYTTRVDTIAREFIRVFNGCTIGGLGNLYLDLVGDFKTRMETGSQIPFKGKWFVFSNRIG